MMVIQYGETKEKRRHGRPMSSWQSQLSLQFSPLVNILPLLPNSYSRPYILFAICKMGKPSRSDAWRSIHRSQHIPPHNMVHQRRNLQYPRSLLSNLRSMVLVMQ
jgi:hypothetical protein